MDSATGNESAWRRLELACIRCLKVVVFVLLYVSGAAVAVMIGVTCADVFLRLKWINRPLTGAYDIVRIAAAIALASALPYTTAVKGHVAIEFFFHKLGKVSRVIVDSVMRLCTMALFGFLGWRSFIYGLGMRSSSQVSQTLQIPVFWLPMVIGFCCFVTALVVAYHLFYPRREMIKP